VKPKRPILRYFGGKWKIAPWIISHFPQHQVYVEPYGGAAGVLLRKPRAYLEIYNDLDREVVNVFRVMRDPVLAKELEHLLEFTPFSRDEFSIALERSKDPVENARRTIIRAFQGFSTTGIFKGNSGFRAKDSRNMGSSAARQWSNYWGLVPSFTNRLQGVVIENRPAIEVIEHQDTEGTLFYVDPPYVLSTRDDNGLKYKFEMSNEEHTLLAEVLHQVKGMVVISGYPCELYEELYGDWDCITKLVTANGYMGGVNRTEVLWLLPAVQLAKAPLFRKLEAF